MPVRLRGGEAVAWIALMAGRLAKAATGEEARGVDDCKPVVPSVLWPAIDLLAGCSAGE